MRGIVPTTGPTRAIGRGWLKFASLLAIGVTALFVWQRSARLQENVDDKDMRPQLTNVNPRQAIVTTGLNQAANSNRLVVFSDPFVSPGSQTLVSGLPADALPQSLAYYGSDNALVGDGLNSRIFVVQVSTASVISTINTAAAGYEGTGTIAVTPNLTAALAMGNFAFAPTEKLYVVRAPFGPSSQISSVTLPGHLASGQTQAIVFNSAGRAFVYHTTGISVLDAPYTAIAFTIPTPYNGTNGAIAISPDGNTLLTTEESADRVHIFKAPFSAATTGATLIVPNGNGLDGIAITPDGSTAIVTSAGIHHAAAIAAPFSVNSVVSDFNLPPGQFGFEDVGISADSQIAILAGQGPGEPLVFVKAPFNSSSVTSSVPIQGPFDGGRGFGAARFLPPGFASGLTVSASAPTNVLPGANLTYTISYANTGTTAAGNVVIRDPLPVGTTFVSATGGGTLNAGNVVFNIGSLAAGSATQTVSFTINVNAASGTITNGGYTIEADGVSQIPGPPVATSVGAPSPTPTLTPTPTPSGTPTPTPGPTPLVYNFNASAGPTFSFWDPSLTAVGWYITPNVSMNLTKIETNFSTASGANRNVTLEILTDRRAAGGTLLRSVVFDSVTARGQLGGGTFAPLAITAGTRYFIGFRKIGGLGINSTSDAGAVNCGACLYLDNANSAEGQYQVRGGSDQPSVVDQPILRLTGASTTTCGEIVGVVQNAQGAVPGALVQACEPNTGPCPFGATTDAGGNYHFFGIPLNTPYDLKVYPPAGYVDLPGTLLNRSVSSCAAPLTGQNLVLVPPSSPPPGTTLVPSSSGTGGVPTVFWRDTLTLTTTGGANRSARYQITQDNVTLASGPMPETPVGSGSYRATVPALAPAHGTSNVSMTVEDPGGGNPSTSNFPIYNDPSGIVQTTRGGLVVGATVVLLRSDTANGTFATVPDGSAQMSPGNRRNPDLTNSRGMFGWDVITGFYKVRASKSGCFAPGNPGQAFVETSVQTIPPPVFDLVLTLECPNAAVTGRVLTPSGLGLRNALVSLIDSAGVRRTASTSPFGVFSFSAVPAGGSYTLTVTSKRYRFSPQVLQVNGDLTLPDIFGLE